MTRRDVLVLTALAHTKRGVSAGLSTPIVIDTDVGSDDLLAIAFLLSRRDVQIEAITVVNGLAHVVPGALNVCRLLTLAGQSHIPVYAGLEGPLRRDRAFPVDWRRASEQYLPLR